LGSAVLADFRDPAQFYRTVSRGRRKKEGREKKREKKKKERFFASAFLASYASPFSHFAPVRSNETLNSEGEKGGGERREEKEKERKKRGRKEGGGPRLRSSAALR